MLTKLMKRLSRKRVWSDATVKHDVRRLSRRRHYR
jgi:hypothetical protein